MSNSFDRWIDELRDDVIQGEYGHKKGEYIVCPEVWRSLFDQGLSPAEAFRSTLGMHGNARKPDTSQRLMELKHLEYEDAAAIWAGQTLH